MTLQRNDLTPPLVLVFAAADPTGGAGIQADMLTLAGMGCHALTVITALTVQDTAGVEDVLAVGQKVQVQIAEIDDRGKLSLVPVVEEESDGGEPAAEDTDSE